MIFTLKKTGEIMNETMLYRKYGRIICNIDRMVYCFRIQDYYKGLNVHRQTVSMLMECIQWEGEAAVCGEEWNVLATALLAAQEAKDYLRMADIYELRIKRFCETALMRLQKQGIWLEATDFYEENYRAASVQIQEVLNAVGAEKEDIPQEYELVETKAGTFSLRHMFPSGQYIMLSGTGNPFEEARCLAESCGSEKYFEYRVLGLGMGYLGMALGEFENIVQFAVYEQDPYVIKAAFHYMDLRSLLLKGKMRLFFDPALALFSKALSALQEDVGLVIHYPSLQNIGNQELKQKVADYFLQESSVRSQRRKLDGNFRLNTAGPAMHDVKALDDLRTVFCGKNMLFIAGGPSVEAAIPFLQECILYQDQMPDSDNQYIVVCAGTVLRLLLMNGIRPDYVVMTDAQENMTEQILGVMTEELSLIYLPTVYSGVLRQWKGAKYMALQKNYPLSEQMAEAEGRMLFETGGSVSTLALDMGLRFGCSRIACLGLDLAYVGGKRHAGTNENVSLTESEEIRVPSVNGGLIATGRNLNQYRLWIERRIAGRTEAEKKTALINLSSGATINGMINDSRFFEGQELPENGYND